VHFVEPEVQPVMLRIGNQDAAAELTLSRADRADDLRLFVSSELGEWAGWGRDIFGALRALMTELDRHDGRIGVAGARPNAWASGMQRDMGVGRSVYLLSLPRTSERPPIVHTLEPAPLDEVGSTADQDDFQGQWMPRDAR
jgi:hypothetical protein